MIKYVLLELRGDQLLTNQMILKKYLDIISENFIDKVCINGDNEQDQGLAEDHFSVQISTSSTTASTFRTNAKSISISIKYFQKYNIEKIYMYEILDKLEKLLCRNIKIDSRTLEFTKSEAEIKKQDDEKDGYTLYYSTFISFYDDVQQNEENNEIMQSINLKLGE